MKYGTIALFTTLNTKKGQDRIMKGILAVGDCITLGVEQCLGNSYPEKTAKSLGVKVKNSQIHHVHDQRGAGTTQR